MTGNGMTDACMVMVEWWTQNAPRRQQFHVAPATTTKQHSKYTTLVDIYVIYNMYNSNCTINPFTAMMSLEKEQ